jgi:hypothetical protein
LSATTFLKASTASSNRPASKLSCPCCSCRAASSAMLRVAPPAMRRFDVSRLAYCAKFELA